MSFDASELSEDSANDTNRPCSVHNVDAAIEYAKLLKAYSDVAKEDLHIIMRVYFEKLVLGFSL